MSLTVGFLWLIWATFPHAECAGHLPGAGPFGPGVVRRLVSHIVRAWQLAGLIDTINDERGYIPHEDLRSFLGLTAADAIPDEVDAVARRLQAAVSDVLG